ncbi:MAG TPA: hypothetical protein VFV81_03535, partial [Verrucomicrobiae bacterium]|nr:hypothetical protein [Verrucomicrobiae bacterium]
MKRWLFLWVFMLGTTVYASPVNDDFVHSIQVTSTNLDYAGDMEGASLELGEPTNGATNTIWISWASPVTGYATLLKDAASQFQYYAVYTGPVVDHLEPVDLVPLYFNSYYRFLATKGTVYRFQFSGGASPIHFHLQSCDFEDVANDNFSEATAILGEQLTFQGSIGDATMELGEPAHMGAMVPQKSVWWKWQAPLWGIYRMDPASSLATNVTLAAYSGSSVEALTFIAKADHSNPLEFSVIGGQTYYIAAAVGTNVGGDVRVMASYAPADTSAHAIAGNLLLEPSWEGTGILGAKHWGMSGGIGGCVNESFGGADGTTWPALSGGAKVWQGFSTTPGHSYAVRFADLIGGKASGGAGDGQIGVMLNNTFLKSFTIPENESGFWHWAECTFLATNRSSLVTFTNMGRTIELDAFSA